MALKSSKKKPNAAAVTVPQTDAEAASALADLGTQMNRILRLKADLNDAIAKLSDDVQTQATPIFEEIAKIEAGLEIWAKANRQRLTEGKTKTITLATGLMSWRDQPASVKLKKGVEEDAVVAELRAAGWKRFIRTHYTINKTAMLDEADLVNEGMGTLLTVKSAGEKFYAMPAGVELEVPA